MPCLLVIIGLFFPRVALGLLWLFTPYVEQGPFRNWLLPLLGLIFLPYTTLACVWAINTEFGLLQLLAMIIGVMVDVGSWGGSAYERRRAYYA